MSRVAAGALAVSALAVISLHGLRSDLSPLSERLSSYATGPFGWLMTAAFFAGAIGLLALAVGRHAGPVTVRVLLTVAAVGMAVSGLFPAATADVWHSPASTVATVAVVAVVALSARAGRRHSRSWPQVWVAAAAVLLIAVSPVLHDTAWSGLGQRLLWGVLYAALLAAALQRPSAGMPASQLDVSPANV